MKFSHMMFGGLLVALSSGAMAVQTVATEAERDKANLNAGENYPVIKFSSTKTRAEVIAELEAARQGIAAPAPVPAPTSKPRAPKDAPAVKPKSQSGFDASLYQGA